MSDVQTPTGTGRSGPSDDDLRRSVPSRAGAREARVGIFIIVGFVSALTALFLMTDPSLFRGRYVVTSVVNDAGGLRRADPVQMRGVNIGRVMDFEMVPDGVSITLEIEGEYGVPADSRVRLVGVGLLGGRTVEVLPGRSGDLAQPGDVLPGDVSSDAFGLASEVGDEAKDAIRRVNELLSEPTVTSVQAGARELESLLTDLASLSREQRSELSQLSASLNESARSVRETASAAGPDLASAAARADSTLATMNRTSASLDEAVGALRQIIGRIDRGEGTLGRLASEDSLYVNMNAAALSLQLLLEDIRQNPGRYISLSIF